ncbi:type IV-A pilus assembly ATPase PilB [gamma proteobacterium HIMB55]|nr:type IV-A pilus assembly ATPase PilB [gamma proteobacterium HIMB55]
MTSSEVNIAASAFRQNGLASRLVDERLINSEEALELVDRARSSGKTLVSELLTESHIDSDVLARLLSDEYGVPVFDLTTMVQDQIPVELVPPTLIRKHRALPLFRRGNRLFIGVSDPTSKNILEEFKFVTGIAADVVIVEHGRLNQIIDEVIAKQDEIFDGNISDFTSAEDYIPDLEVEEELEETDFTKLADDAPVVKFVNKVLFDAIKQGASDIHFEPYEREYRVRVRSDGVLQEVVRPPKGLAPRLAARLKVMARLDISERRTPQDGRIQLKISKNRSIDFRVSTLPTLFGEKIVLRILDPGSARMGVDALGYEPDQKALYLEALSRPQGMILVTGPTGSGKTVSLYTGLDVLNEPERNISTAEDPVEINMEGINQVHVNPKVGLNFAGVLRSFLRQDPDVLMVGEIRDLETAEIAIKAAQTGHLVLSTVHTNSAPETINRLLNMGIPAYNIASSLTLIIAQRLARRLCKYCAEPETDIPKSALKELGFTDDMLKTANIMKPVGCKQCRKGYSGRVGVYEVVKVTKDLSTAILNGANVHELEQAARDAGFYDLRKAALIKCAQGIISLEEVNRVTVD